MTSERIVFQSHIVGYLAFWPGEEYPFGAIQNLYNGEFRVVTRLGGFPGDELVTRIQRGSSDGVRSSLAAAKRALRAAVK